MRFGKKFGLRGFSQPRHAREPPKDVRAAAIAPNIIRIFIVYFSFAFVFVLDRIDMINRILLRLVATARKNPLLTEVPQTLLRPKNRRLFSIMADEIHC